MDHCAGTTAPGNHKQSIRPRLQVLYIDMVPNTSFKYVRRGFQMVDERHRRLGVSLPLYVYTVRAFV